MKKTRSNHNVTDRIAIGKAANTATPKSVDGNKAIPIPPSEEVIARLNKLAREYPFCVMYKENNLTLL